VGLETAHSILVDFLWAQGYTSIFVLPPTLVKGSRTRMRSSSAKDDPGEAYLMADILRTDQGRLLPWQPDSSLSRQLHNRTVHLVPYSKYCQGHSSTASCMAALLSSGSRAV